MEETPGPGKDVSSPGPLHMFVGTVSSREMGEKVHWLQSAALRLSEFFSFPHRREGFLPLSDCGECW